MTCTLFYTLAALDAIIMTQSHSAILFYHFHELSLNGGVSVIILLELSR